MFCLQACYGHTEGTAGITGALLAVTALRQAAAAPIVNLRSVSPYVTAALSDWRALKGIDPLAPRQLAPGPLLRVRLARFLVTVLERTLILAACCPALSNASQISTRHEHSNLSCDPC